MTTTQHSNPYGYRELLVYKKAEEMQSVCAHLTSHFPPFSHSSRSKTLLALADQMDRSARSVKQNVVEGWKRNSTKEYCEFLGFSLGANAELEEDCNDIIKGVYQEMGLKGEKGEIGLEAVERLPFYPLDSRLPPVVQLKLRCKELNMLLQKLQNSLEKKMREGSGILKSAWGTGERGKKGEEWLEKAISEQGLVRMPDGKLMKREKGEKEDKKNV